MHPFIPNTPEDREKIFKKLGIGSFKDLLKDIPEELLYKGEINLPDALSEQEVLSLLEDIAKKNKTLTLFAGGGAYDHYVPQVVDYIVQRPEFYTAYTPYQAEVSQGTLQAIFEFQSIICNLTGLDVTNASMYDGASAAAEALLMSMRVKRKNKVVISSAINPLYKKVIETYLDGIRPDIVYVDYDETTGMTITKDLDKLVEGASAFLIQHPNYFGVLENMAEISRIVKSKDVMLIEHYYPISLGILKKPSEYSVDIATAEGQSLGLHLNFGGPYVGLFSSKKEYIRQMPGRIIGETIDRDGNKGYVMTLQTREQHIRRERATSNICSNQNLCALRTLIYLSTVGKEGLREVAGANFARAHYLAEKLEENGVGHLAFKGRFFNEFAFRLNGVSTDTFIEKMVDRGIMPGVKIDDATILVAVTEKRLKEELDEYVKTATEIIKER